MKRGRLILAVATAAGLALSAQRQYRPASHDPVVNGKPVSEWANDLSAEDEWARREAQAALKQAGAAAVPALTEVLRRRDWPGQRAVNRLGERVLGGKIRLRTTAGAREAAASLLGELGPKAREAVPELARGLGDPDAVVAAETEQALRSIGAGSVEALVRVLGEGEDRAKAAAARVLEELEGAGGAAFWPLLRAMRDQSPEVREAAAGAVGLVQPRRTAAVAALAEGLKDGSAGVRRRCAEALGKFGELARPAVEDLARATSDGNGETRFQAAKALWLIEKRPEKALPTLIGCLGQPEGWQAAYVLAEMGTNAVPAIPALIAALKRETVPRPIRTPPSSSFALGRIGAAAVPALAELARHPDGRVRLNAVLALGAMRSEGKESMPALLDSLEDGEPNVREVSALSLAAMGATSGKVFPALVQCLRAEDIYVRSAAADRLREIAPGTDWVAQAE